MSVRLFLSAAAMFALAALQSCTSEHNSSFVNVNPRGWSQSAAIAVENVDTVTRRDIAIYMRYRPSRELNDVSLTIQTTAPNEISASDKITLFPAQHKSNKWSSTQFMEVQYRMNVVWNQIGDYNIEITPAKEELGIELVGIKITESKR
ncbi:MAG: hypothetical protein SNH79_06395 [Rikenellaceae bacterium]